MGQNYSRRPIASPLILSGWARQQALGTAIIWRNATTGQQMEEYPFITDSNEDYNLIVDSFNLRLNHQQLVNSKSFLSDPSDDICGCGTTYQGSVFLERIPLRLSDIRQIPFPDVLHVYYQAFVGFSKAVPFIGSFAVQEDMICIDSNDVVKVWLNGDLSKILPNSVELGTEHEMIGTIIDTIDRNTDQTALPASIRAFFRQKSIQTFEQAVLAVYSYATLHSATIPDKLDCLTELRGGKRRKVVQSNLNEVIGSPIIIQPQLQRLSKSSIFVNNLNPVTTSIPAKSLRPIQVTRRSMIVNNVHTTRVPSARQKPVSKLPTRPLLNRELSRDVRNRQPSVKSSQHSLRGNTISRPITTINKSPPKIPQPPQSTQSSPPSISPLLIPNTHKPYLNIEKRRKVEDGHSTDMILQLIKRSREQLAYQSAINREISRYLLTDSPTRPLRTIDHLQDTPRRSQYQQNIAAQSEYDSSEAQTQPKESDMTNATRELYMTPLRRHLEQNMSKSGGLTTDYKFQSESKNEIDENGISRQSLLREGMKKSSYGAAGTTSFQFHSYVGRGQSGLKKSINEINEQVVEFNAEDEIRYQWTRAEQPNKDTFRNPPVEQRPEAEQREKTKDNLNIIEAQLSLQGIATTDSYVQKTATVTYNYEVTQRGPIQTTSKSTQFMASIYIPIQGYRVTLDNQLIADLSQLRTQGLVQQATQKRLGYRTLNSGSP